MKVVKAVFALLLSLVILLCCTWFLAASALSHVLEPSVMGGILAGLDLSGIVDEVLASGMTGLDELTQRLVSSDAVTACISDYIQAYVESILYGTSEPVITGWELEPVLEDALNELAAGDLSPEDALLVMGMQLVVPQLSEQIAGYIQAAVPSRAELLGQLGLSEELLADMLYLIGPTVRTILLVFGAVSALIVMLLYLRRGGGFFWNGTVIALSGAICSAGGAAAKIAIGSSLSPYGLASLTDILLKAFLLRGGLAFGIGTALLLIGAICRTAAAEKRPAASPRHGR